MSIRDRERQYRTFGWWAFGLAILCFLTAAWTFDQRWLATAFVFLFASLVLCIARADLR